jgi:hypothetical protein
LFVTAGCLNIQVYPPAAQPQEKQPSTASSDPKKPEASQGEAKKEKLKPFEEVVRGTETLSGLFTVYRSDEHLYFEILPERLGRSLFWAATLDRGVGDGGLVRGVPFGTEVVEFRKAPGDRLLLMEKNTRFRADPGSPTHRDVEKGFPDAIQATLAVVSENPKTHGLLVDLHGHFLADRREIASGLKDRFKAEYSYDKEASRYESVKVFPGNIEVAVVQHFTGKRGGDTPTLSDPRSLQLGIRYSLSFIPENDYRPRLADDRVGHFLTSHLNFTQKDPRTPYVRYVNRWHLKKQNPAADLSPPVEPITFWVDNHTPYEYREMVREGILLWNQAFERIGFRDAVVAHIQPDDADWDPADSRYNVVQWVTSFRNGWAGFGPSRANPLTGQILDADPLVEGESVRRTRRSYLLYIRDLRDRKGRDLSPWAGFEGHCGYAQELAMESILGLNLMEARGAIGPQEVPAEYLRQMLVSLVAHEVGHTLGLRHNFKASTWNDLADIHNAEVTSKRGLSGSVMDYLAPNIAPEGIKQGEYFETTLGPYDYWAIEYAYRGIEADSSEGELPELAEIASRAPQPGLAYGTDEDAGSSDDDGRAVLGNPYTAVFDLTSDPMGYAEGQLREIRRLLPKVAERVARPGEGYEPVREVFASLLGQYRRQLGIFLRFVGAQQFHRHHVGDPQGKLPFEPISASEQRRALRLIARYGLDDGAFRFSAELLNSLGADRWHYFSGRDQPLGFYTHDPIEQMHDLVLDRLLRPEMMERIREGERRVLPSEETVTLPELFAFLTDEIWSELKRVPGTHTERDPFISDLRRSLQRNYTHRLAAVVRGRIGAMAKPEEEEDEEGEKEGRGGFPKEGRALAWFTLRDLQGRLSPWIDRPGLDVYSRVHLAETYDRIQKVMEGRMEIE